MATKIEKVLQDTEKWLEKEKTWEDDLDGLDAIDIAKAVIHRIRERLSA